MEKVRQSPPLDDMVTYNEAWVKDKTIVITGGASGFGAGFLQRWAAAGATVIIGDVNVQKGEKLIEAVRKETGNKNLHFVHCDVRNWQSQVALFKKAVAFSPHGGIDTVVASAGITDQKMSFEAPTDLHAAEPPPPALDVIDVNLTGVLYTTHLALFYLARNPNSAPANPRCDPAQTPRDRHLILLGSVASLLHIPGQSLYGASKHAILGLYRCLRSSAFVHGVRVNLICPYFIDTPLLGAPGRIILAGGSIGTTASVVEAATRFAANPRIVGRAVLVAPTFKVTQEQGGEWQIAEAEGEGGEEKAVWEIYVHDFEDSDVFQRNVVSLLNRAAEINGWKGWAVDMIGAAVYAIRAWWKG
ncbi:MAG: hypothetical protein FRX48_08098 [Lasallia pustulata]|uniref:Short-chain dehydrogenase/reductase, conserved site n=1 Tax=Lasallia pustulata TaxID=136370 RepID=A0A1W5CV70_9LECA|nr:MAG: hypothetical protein FRX48_08098 [Lasallia pustulata]SLM34721.1 Short-chain dehydrogenase/reductase, conserved site [Lasallia pustulata]